MFVKAKIKETIIAGTPTENRIFAHSLSKIESFIVKDLYKYIKEIAKLTLCVKKYEMKIPIIFSLRIRINKISNNIFNIHEIMRM